MKDFLKVLWSFYGRLEKQYLVSLFLLTLALAGLEMVGAGVFFAYTSILADSEIIFENKYLRGAYEFFEFQEIHLFLIFLGVAVFCVLLVRGLLSLMNLYFQARFTAHIRNLLSTRLLETYMNRSFESSLSLNSAVLSKHLLVEVDNVVSCVKQSLLLLTEVAVCTALVLVVIFYRSSSGFLPSDSAGGDDGYLGRVHKKSSLVYGGH